MTHRCLSLTNCRYFRLHSHAHPLSLSLTRTHPHARLLSLSHTYTHAHSPIHSHTLFHPFSFLQHTWHIHFREIQKIGTGGVKDGKFFSVENVGAMKLLLGTF